MNKAVAEANIATILLDLFFKYSLNNFLHAQVKKGVGLCTYNIGILHIPFFQVESCLRSILFWKEKAAVKAEETEPSLESSSLETPKINLEGEEKKDCEEGSTGHPLDHIQVGK